jgi:hypothetical protein
VFARCGVGKCSYFVLAESSVAGSFFDDGRAFHPVEVQLSEVAPDQSDNPIRAMPVAMGSPSQTPKLRAVFRFEQTACHSVP